MRHSRGFAFARCKNLAAYTAVACEVEVERETGEAAQGPTAAAPANAVADATDVRIRDLPFTPQRVNAAIGI